MRTFYTDKGIDILKDAVSIPGVSFTLLAPRMCLRGAQIFTARAKEAYEMLKAAVVGGPSLVFHKIS